MAGKSEISFDHLMNNLKNKIYHPVYFFHGEEPYFIDILSDYIEDHVLNDLEKEFNQTIVYGKDSNVATIVSYARRFPMMANYQVLIVKEAQDLDQIEAFQPYMENPQTSTILVLCYKYAKFDKRKVLCKTIEKTGIIFESTRFYENKIPDWINEYLRQRNHTIQPKAAALLTEFLGADLGKIVNEIQKLLISLAPGAEVTEEVVEKNIGISKDYNVFELQKALSQHDIVKANRIILFFAANPRENPLVKVVPILFSYFSKILTFHYLTDKSRNSVASALGINPFFVNDFQQAARNFPIGRTVHTISLLREYDMKSKGVENNAAYASDGELMKELIFRILH